VACSTFGIVYKAIHKRTGQIVAIKRVPVKKDLVEIMKEIAFMRQCHHDHIVKFYGHFLYDEALWVPYTLFPWLMGSCRACF